MQIILWGASQALTQDCLLSFCQGKFKSYVDTQESAWFTEYLVSTEQWLLKFVFRGSRISLNIIRHHLLSHTTIDWGCTSGFTVSGSDVCVHSRLLTSACMFKYMYMWKVLICVFSKAYVCTCDLDGPAAPLSKFKLSCGNISLALQSTRVTWWTENASHNKHRVVRASALRVQHRLGGLQILNVDATDERCMPQGMFFELTFTRASANWTKHRAKHLSSAAVYGWGVIKVLELDWKVSLYTTRHVLIIKQQDPSRTELKPSCNTFRRSLFSWPCCLSQTIQWLQTAQPENISISLSVALSQKCCWL